MTAKEYLEENLPHLYNINQSDDVMSSDIWHAMEEYSEYKLKSAKEEAGKLKSTSDGKPNNPIEFINEGTHLVIGSKNKLHVYKLKNAFSITDETKFIYSLTFENEIADIMKSSKGESLYVSFGPEKVLEYRVYDLISKENPAPIKIYS